VASSEVWAANIKNNKTLRCCDSIRPRLLFYGWAISIIAFVLKNADTYFKKNSTRGLAVASSAKWAAIVTKNNKLLRYTDSISTRLFFYGWAIYFVAFVLKNTHTNFMKNSTRGLAVASSVVWATIAIKNNKSLRCTVSICPRRLSYGWAIFFCLCVEECPHSF
jgi:hypothetical protein